MSIRETNALLSRFPSSPYTYFYPRYRIIIVEARTSRPIIYWLLFASTTICDHVHSKNLPLPRRKEFDKFIMSSVIERKMWKRTTGKKFENEETFSI